MTACSWNSSQLNLNLNLNLPSPATSPLDSITAFPYSNHPV